MDNRLPYSYHTFLYPFTYENEVKDIIDTDTWIIEENVENKLSNIDFTKNEFTEEKRLEYATFNYFSPKARYAIFNTAKGNETSVHYTYRPAIKQKKDEPNLYYKIETDKETILLEVNKIRLSLFERVKIGVITFELENHDSMEYENPLEKFQRASFINAVGRQLFWPSITGVNTAEMRLESFVKTKKIIISDKIEDGEGKETIVVDMDKQIQQYLNDAEHNTFDDINPELIRKILGKTTELQMGDIKPVLDDRMFTASIVLDDCISKIIENKKVDNASKILYSYIFVDGYASDCTCQNEKMRRDLLAKHVYDRWVDYGTLHGVTEYSLVCVTSSDYSILNSVINPFLTEYVSMALLSIVQRASINSIETDIVNLCTQIKKRTFGRNKEIITGIDDNEVTKLWEKYIIFQNELLLPEVTFQTQGVELYQKLKEALKITELNRHIEEELNNLHELADLEADRKEKEREDKLNRTMNLLGILAVVSAITDGIAFLDVWFNSNPDAQFIITKWVYHTVKLGNNLITSIGIVCESVHIILMLIFVIILIYRLYIGKRR